MSTTGGVAAPGELGMSSESRRALRSARAACGEREQFRAAACTLPISGGCRVSSNCTAGALCVSVMSLMPRDGVVEGERECEDVAEVEPVRVAVAESLGEGVGTAVLLREAELLSVSVGAGVAEGHALGVLPSTVALGVTVSVKGKV